VSPNLFRPAFPLTPLSSAPSVALDSGDNVIDGLPTPRRSTPPLASMPPRSALTQSSALASLWSDS
jgi:hypothetical protein